MYPLHTWQFAGLESRLNKLLAQDLDFESIVASTQVIEQLIKRIMRDHMARSGRHLRKVENGSQLRLVQALSVKDIETSLMQHAQSIQKIRTFWGRIMPPGSTPLPAVFDSICGHGTWLALTATLPFAPVAGLGLELIEQTLNAGLFATRHKIVHGLRAPPQGTVRALAPFGVKVALHLAHPEQGLTTLEIRDPFLKSFPFRPRP